MAISCAKDILGDFDCEIEERRVSSLTLHLKMPESAAAVTSQQSKASDSLLELVTKQVGQKGFGSCSLWSPPDVLTKVGYTRTSFSSMEVDCLAAWAQGSIWKALCRVNLP